MSQSSNIKDHWAQNTIKNPIIMKTFEILWALPKCDTEIQSEPMLLEKKNDANRLVQHRVTTKFQFVKHRWYLWSITKQSKIKWGMPACDKDTHTHTHTHTHVWAQWKNHLNRLAGVQNRAYWKTSTFKGHQNTKKYFASIVGEN